MKTTMLFLSFLLFAFSTTSLLVAADDTLDPVLDINGDELQASERYYALPRIWAMGGGLTWVTNIIGTLCPLNVVQSSSETNNGDPLMFLPIQNGEDVIRVSTALDIVSLNIPLFCRQSTLWTLQGVFVTMGGARGNFSRNFQIQKYSELGNTYKFVYCVDNTTCRDIGPSIMNGIRPLTILNDPLQVVFVKAEGSRIKKITHG